ncbi:proteasome subunit alpha [Iamia majanohamensis]|uniref:Proteasome subunit alpha n=1 Tax=Iamia majanohamensis TaxID=467976 RepID=A0AAE9YDK2_9ACTN|nr:proteasome subunit alpha [Iamia majanohamensis]WCO69208.1 proteasome subunit alpha [Iamia majanohamensis]
MGMPFYVAPEQVMKDRADYARKGIARGRSLIAAICADGILLCAENPSATLRKISEIYDRIAFAGVGRYNEFDQLRVAGVRHADLKGYSYSREDVDARSLANAYAQSLGQVFTHEMKPLEVEILVAEVAEPGGRDQLFHILYDGTVIDEPARAVLGGDAEAIAGRFEETHSTDATVAEALAAAVTALAGPDRTLGAAEVEAAVLDRGNGRRSFRRLTDEEISAAVGSADTSSGDGAGASGRSGDGDDAPGPEAAGAPADDVPDDEGPAPS